MLELKNIKLLKFPTPYVRGVDNRSFPEMLIIHGF